MKAVRFLEAHERKGLPGARHRDVVQPARIVWILAMSGAVPAAVQCGHMIELQTLCAVRGQQQKAALAPANVTPPFGQPLDEVAHRGFPAAGFQRVLVDGLAQQVVPRAGGFRLRSAVQGGAVDDTALPAAQPFDERPGLAQAPEVRNFLIARLRRNTVRLAERAHRNQILPLARDHRAPRPVPVRRKGGKAQQLRHGGSRLRNRVAAGRQDLHPPQRDRVEFLPRSARRVLHARSVDVEGVPGLHPLPRRLDHRVGGGDDVAGGTVVAGEIGGPGSVIRLETADELHRGAVEGVDVLIVVADREQGELARLVVERSPGQRRYQGVLVRADVLVLIDKDPAEPRQQPAPGARPLPPATDPLLAAAPPPSGAPPGTTRRPDAPHVP